MEYIIYVILFIVISGVIMVGTNILYDLAAVVIPFAAIFMIVVGIVVGFAVAVKNTFLAYRRVYGRR